MYRKRGIFFLGLFLVSLSIFADPSKSDVFKVELDGKIYYYVQLSQGTIEDDFCYKSEIADYEPPAFDVETGISYYIKNNKTITLYKDYFVILGHQFYHGIYSSSNVNALFNKVGSKEFKVDYFLKNYKIVDAFNVPAFAITVCSTDIKEIDSTWMEHYEFEKIFELVDGDDKNVDFFAIKGNVGKEESENIKARLEAVVGDNDWKKYNEELSFLYKRYIIMLCECYE